MLIFYLWKITSNRKKKRLKSLKETMKKFTCSKKNAASITATPRRVVLGSSELDEIRGLTSKDGHDLFRLTAWVSRRKAGVWAFKTDLTEPRVLVVRTEDCPTGSLNYKGFLSGPSFLRAIFRIWLKISNLTQFYLPKNMSIYRMEKCFCSMGFKFLL